MVKILIVEDDMITAADISMQLTQSGYEISGITPRGEDALKSIEATRPDLVLMDVNLKGTLDGVETAQKIYDQYGIPLIFLTANADGSTFSRAKAAKPYAFISKPFQPSDLEHAIDLTLERVMDEGAMDIAVDSGVADKKHVLTDRVFVRYRDHMVKVLLDEILFVEADRNYCKIHADGKEYLLTVPLGAFEEKFPRRSFMRVHRSFIVNLTRVDALGGQSEFLIFGEKQVPVSRNFREELMERLRVI